VKRVQFPSLGTDRQANFNFELDPVICNADFQPNPTCDFQIQHFPIMSEHFNETTRKISFNFFTRNSKRTEIFELSDQKSHTSLTMRISEGK